MATYLVSNSTEQFGNPFVFHIELKVLNPPHKSCVLVIKED